MTEEIPNSNFSGVPIKGKITVRNIGGQISKLQIAIISSMFLNPAHQKLSVNKIPPFGFLTFDIKFDKTPILTNTRDVVTITLNGKSIFKNLRIVPIFLHELTLIAGGILFVIITIILSITTLKARRLSVLRQKEQDTIRWESEKSQKKS
jgi:hypothetical protein